MRLKLMVAMKVAALLSLLFIGWASFVLIDSMDQYFRAFQNPKLYPPPFSRPFWGDFIINYFVISFMWAFGIGAIYLLRRPVRSHPSRRAHQIANNNEH